MSEIRVNVEGAPEAVAKFFKEMGQTQFIKGDKTTFVETLLPPINIENGIQISGSAQVGGEALSTTEEKKTRKPRQKKEDKVEVTEETPDPEFEGVPGEDENIVVTGKFPNVEGLFDNLPKAETLEFPPLKPIDTVEEVIEAQVTEREIIEEKVEETVKNEQDIPEREISLPEVKEALKEYGLWVVEQGNESHYAKEYLVALLRKYGKVEASKDLDAEGRNAVFHAAVNRVPMEELEEFK